MRRTILLTVTLVAGCGTSSLQQQPTGDEKAAQALRRRAEAFLRDQLTTLGPEGKLKESADFQGRVGDLFRAGHSVAAVAFIDHEKPEGGELRTSPGLAFLSHRSGRWELRQCFAAEGQLLEGILLELKDLSGDGVPEVLFLESWGATGNDSWSVFRYSPKSDGLVLAAESLGRPEWDGKQVRTFGKGGNCGFDNTCESYAWDNDRLFRTSVSSQSGLADDLQSERAVKVEYREFDKSGRQTYGWKAVGNLPSYRNLVGEILPAKLVTDITVGGRRRLVNVEPVRSKIREAGLEAEFVALVSEAVYRRPEEFQPDVRVKTSKGKLIRLADIARITVTEGNAGPVEKKAP
jgi:hypothetical protein